MKTFLSRCLFLFICLGVPSYASSNEVRAKVLYNNSRQPSEALLVLLKHFGIHAQTWEGILSATQAKWVNKPGTERWQFEAQKDSTPEKTYALFSQLQMLQSLVPQETHFEAVVICGATLPAVRRRLSYLLALWEHGVRFDQIVLLGGDRKLDPTIESESVFMESPYPLAAEWVPPSSLPQNEAEMMEFAFHQMALPSEWRSFPLFVVHTPTPAGQLRPNRLQTLEYWKKTAPLPRTALLISSQPYVGRDDTCVRQVFPTLLKCESVGERFSFDSYLTNPKGLTLLQDELARWIYQEQKLILVQDQGK